MSSFIEKIKERAKQDKKTIVLPESMDRRTFEAAAQVLKEDIANLIIIGTEEEIAKVEEIVNEQIKRDLPVTCEEMTLEEAKASGATGLFENK